MIFSTFNEDDLDAAPAHTIAPAALLDGDAPVDSLLQRLRIAGNADARRVAVHGALRDAGFDWLCYTRILRIGEHVSHAMWFDSYSPAGWPDAYQRASFFDIDPRVAFVCRSEWPFAWDLDSLFNRSALNQPGSPERRFVDAALASGSASGVTVGIATANPVERCVVTLSSRHPGQQWLSDTTLGAAYGLAVDLHEFIDAHPQFRLPRLNSDGLSADQQAILQCMAMGMHDSDIAHELSMTRSEVSHHLKQLIQRYHANSKVQLAYIAGALERD